MTNSLYTGLQELSGARLTECNHSGDVIDYDIRREAREDGLALPTAGETDRERYHGAVVGNPSPGLHNHVTYPDFSSLYPNIMLDINTSPETIVGVGPKAVIRSEYSREELRWSYIDRRPIKDLAPHETYSDFTNGEYKMVVDDGIKWRDDWSRIQEHLETIYFKPPSEQQGILPSRAEQYIRWNKSFTGAMYAATKQQRNCFTADTEVLTPDGVKNIRDLSVDDDVYSIDPETMVAETKSVTAVHEHPEYDDELVGFENTYVDFQVTPNHRFLVSDGCTETDYHFENAGDLAESGKSYTLPNEWTVNCDGLSFDKLDLTEWCDNYEVLVEPSVHGHTFADELGFYPDCRSHSKKWDVTSGYILDSETFEENREAITDLAARTLVHRSSGDGWVPRTYDVDDVLELIGWFTAEGSVHISGRRECETAVAGKVKTVSIAQKTSHYRDEVRSLLERLELPYSESDNGFTVCNSMWYDLLEEWCGSNSHEKQLPDWVFQACEDRRTLLFNTLVDGDGDEGENSYRYTTASRQLRDDMMRLVMSLGRNPRYTTHNGTVWRIWYSDTENTLRPRRCTVSTSADDGVYCVTVADNHTLLAGRNGKFQWVGQSLYGVSGDSNFSLFDWRVAEAITIAGRLLLEYAAETMIKRIAAEFGGDVPEGSILGRTADSDETVYVTHGDSVPQDEPTVVRRDDGTVDVLPAQRVHQLHTRGEQMEIWSDDGWTEIRRSIEKPNRKQHYVARTKQGIVRVTEDHSLLRDDGREVTPDEVNEGDQLLHRDVVEALEDTQGGTSDVSRDAAWLLGLFVADGTAGHYVYGHRSDKYSWAITNKSEDRLERAQRIMAEEWNFDTAVNDTTESSGCYKLQSTGQQYNGEKHGLRQDIVDEFCERCYVDGEKRVPPSILNADEDVHTAFLDGYLQGDGGDHGTSALDGLNSMSTKSRVLATGLVMLLREEGAEVTLDYRRNYGRVYYNIRRVSFHRGDPEAVTDIERVEYEGELVYDFETENHHFHAGVGSSIVHNTDGFGLAVNVDATREHILPTVQNAVEWLNETGVPRFIEDELGVPGAETAQEIDLESYSPQLFIPADLRNGGGVKKTYAERVTWDEGEETDELDITGFEAKRSDVAQLTREVQSDVLEAIIYKPRQEAKRRVYERIRGAVERIRSGEYTLAEVGQREGLGKDVSEYGSVERTPMPEYRGAKYSQQFIADANPNDARKVMKYPVERVLGDEYPGTYSARTAEDGTRVDWIAVEDPSLVPDAFVIDEDVLVEKTLKQPLRQILAALNWDFDEAVHGHDQSTVASFA